MHGALQQMNATHAPIADPACLRDVLGEIRHLETRGPLASQGRFHVYLAAAWEIPSILHEIGRLREIAFRGVGEGTGRALDLDRYDASYLHLFLWDRQEQKVAGAYRLGCTDVLLNAGGVSSLYTSTLFHLEQPFLNHLRPAIELGRSFVSREYQKTPHALVLLWRGIGMFVAGRPRYTRLFGPVSISSDYSAVSQEMIVRFLRGRHSCESFHGWVRPHNPYLGLTGGEEISQRLQCIEEVSAVISHTEPDGKGVPVLLRQYLKLNATILEFNVDPDFSDVLDGLILVDLREAPRHALNRYLGQDCTDLILGSSMAGAA